MSKPKYCVQRQGPDEPVFVLEEDDGQPAPRFLCKIDDDQKQPVAAAWKIVEAMNAHHELLQALTFIRNKTRTIQGWMADPGGHTVNLGELMNLEHVAQAALDEVEGSPS